MARSIYNNGWERLGAGKYSRIGRILQYMDDAIQPTMRSKAVSNKLIARPPALSRKIQLPGTRPAFWTIACILSLAVYILSIAPYQLPLSITPGGLQDLPLCGCVLNMLCRYSFKEN
jgi:hypothetical protein